jgi:tRNA1(Val) A37 N6-methylase TrmN6
LTSKNILTTLENIIQRFENKNFIEKKNLRERGVIYTPQPIAHFMALNIFRIFFDEFPKLISYLEIVFDYASLKQLFIKNRDLKRSFYDKINNIKVLDPCCGTGRFLITIAKILFNFNKIFESEYTDYEIKKNIIQDNILGIEIEKISYLISKIRLIKWLYEDSNYQINKSISDNPHPDEIEEFINTFDLDFKLFNQDYLTDFEGEDVDIIIGNPPYVENKKIRDKVFKNKIQEKFESAYKLFDLSVIFIEKSLKLLKNNVGCLSFITTNKFLSADYGVKIREILLQNTEIREIINTSSLPIFKNTAAYPIILFLKKEKTVDNLISIKEFDSIKDIKNNSCKYLAEFPQKSILNFPSHVIPLSDKITLIEKIYSKFNILSNSFKDLKIIYRPFGFIEWAKNSKYIILNKDSNKDLLLLSTGNVGRYFIDFNKKIKIGNDRYQNPYYRYNQNFSENWKELSDEKLIFREIAKDLTFVYDPGVFTNLTGLYFLRIPSLTTDQLFSLLGILNSKLVNQIFKSLYGTLHMSGHYLRINGSFIKRLPVPSYLPDSLCYVSKILQFLTQLRYELIQKPALPPYNKIELRRIKSFIKFYEDLSNSIVDQLYLEINKKDVDFDAKDFPNINFKFIKAYYNFPRFEIYSDEEFFKNLNKIGSFYDLFN